MRRKLAFASRALRNKNDDENGVHVHAPDDAAMTGRKSGAPFSPPHTSIKRTKAKGSQKKRLEIN